MSDMETSTSTLRITKLGFYSSRIMHSYGISKHFVVSSVQISITSAVSHYYGHDTVYIHLP